MKKIYKQFSFIIGAFLIASCEIHNPAEPVPAYIHIDEFSITTDYAFQGSNSNKITDAWVYLDDELQGCYELPATFPIIATGNHKLKIKPGIKVNGISSDRVPYPFYTTYEQNINFKAGETFNLNPASTYNSYTNFAFKEDFESTGITFTSVNSDTSLQFIELPDANVFEGSKSAVAYVDPDLFFECRTVNAFTLQRSSNAVFLEFNYNCNFEFAVSVLGYGNNQSFEQSTVLYVNPSNSWNKIYVNLTPVLNGFNYATSYKIAFSMKNNAGMNNASLLLDNIKLIY